MARTSPQRSRILVGVLIALIAVIVWRVLTFEPFVTARRLQSELDSARAESLVTSLSDLPPAHVPANGNAASIYREVTKDAMGDDWPRLSDIRIAVRSREAKDVAKANAARPLLESVMKKFEEGTKLPSADFGHDPAKGYGTVFADEHILVSMVAVLRWDAEAALARNDVETALSKAEEMARVAKQLGDEPYLTVVGLRAHVLADLFALLEPVVHKSGNLPSIRLRVRQVLDQIGPHPDYRRVLARELPASLASVDSADPKAWKSAAPSFAEFDRVASAAKIPPLRDAFKVRLVQFWRTAFAKLPKNSDDLHGVQTALFDAQATQEGKPEFSYTLSKLLYDEYASDVAAFNGSEARMALLRTALDWAEGKRQLPVDPDSGKPMHFKRLKEGEVIYSVGPDGKDDDASSTSGLGGMPIDIIARLPRTGKP